MRFDQPLWILAAVFSCTALFLLHLRLEKRRNTRLHSFAAASRLTRLTGNLSVARRRIKLALVLAALFLCLLALARPQYGHRWVDTKRRGIDILFAVDTSASMLARDIRPNRLERSKLAILDFVERLGGDRVGLMPFAGSAFLMCPLTIDYTAFEETLQALDTTIIPEPGTNLEGAIDEAGNILDNDANHKLLVIVTDGEGLEGNAFAAADRARNRGMTIFTVGVGTREGELVPLMPQASGKTAPGYVKDERGRFVVSRLDENSLRRISQVTDGLYAPLGSRGQGLESIYNRKLTLIPKAELAEKRQKVGIERFPWFLGMALFLLVLEYLIAGRKSPPPFTPPWKRRKVLAMLVLSVLAASAAKHSKASPGEEAYSRADYETAVQYYEELLDEDAEDAVHFNYGAAAYKNRLYDEAITAFTSALHSDNPQLQEKAYFNRGNAHFKKGEESLEDDAEETAGQWEKALDSYEAALALQPEDTRAKNNYRTVRKKLEELRKRQQAAPQENQEKQGGPEDSKPPAKQKRQQRSDSGGPRQDQPSEADRETNAMEKGTDEQTGRSDSVNAPSPQTDDGSEQAEQSRQQMHNALNRRQALQLLEEMKNEEGTLNFVPQKPRSVPDKRGKDW